MNKKEQQRIRKNLNRRIARKNKKFAAMSKAEKRICIAKDVLQQLKIGKLISQSGVWVSLPLSLSLKEKDKSCQLQQIFSGVESCRVCALGGIFVSAVEHFDKLKLNNLSNIEDIDFTGFDFNDIEKYLSKFFTKSQLRLIEIAFEEGEGGYHPKTRLEDTAENFCIGKSTKDKMIMIMKNIIVNNGSFNPRKS